MNNQFCLLANTRITLLQSSDARQNLELTLVGVCVCLCECVRVCVCIYYTHIHTSIYIYIYTHVTPVSGRKVHFIDTNSLLADIAIHVTNNITN
jgi:hypothetical protein